MLPSQLFEKEAVTDLSSFIVSVQVVDLPLQSPPQPSKEWTGPGAGLDDGVAVRVTEVLSPWLYGPDGLTLTLPQHPDLAPIHR